MTFRLLLAVAAALAVVATAAAVPNPLQISSNWSGYAITGSTFSDATGTWRQPAARCAGGRASSSSFWVGIGGFSEGAQSLEQLGSVADCNPDGTASYRLWYEVIPAPAQFVTLKVAPGDTVTAAVVVEGQQVTFSIKNVTHGTRFSKVLTVAHPLDVQSAEWIAEAPSLCSSSSSCRIVPLTNFGSVGFSEVAAIGGGHPGTITDPAWTVTPIALVASAGRARFAASSNPAGALPQTLTPDGRGFSVAFRANLAPPDGTAPAAPLAGGPVPPWVGKG